RLVLEQAELRAHVLRHRSVTIEVVGSDLQGHADTRTEAVDVLELEAGQLAGDPGVRANAAGQVAQWPPDVAGNLDGDIPGLQHASHQLGGGRLAVGARDADDRALDQPVAELDLAPDRHARTPRGDDQRVAPRCPG